MTSYHSSLPSYQIIFANRKKSIFTETFASNLQAAHANVLTRNPQSWDLSQKVWLCFQQLMCHKSRSLVFPWEVFLKKRKPFTAADCSKGRKKFRFLTVSLPFLILLPTLPISGEQKTSAISPDDNNSEIKRTPNRTKLV